MNNIDDIIADYVKNINDSNDKIFIENKSESKVLEVIDDLNNNILKENKYEIEKYEQTIENLKLKRRIQRNRESNILTGLINILDSIEWLLNGSLIFSNNGIEKTVNTTKKLINRELENIKVIKTPNVGDLYNENYHICLGYNKDDNLVNNQILQVVRSGYIFRDKVLRQAEVIVVNNDMKDGDEDEYNRY